MRTELTTSPERAAEYIRSGGIAAFPTETVYGLGADAFNAAAIARIFEAKKRPADNPLIAHIGDAADIGRLVAEVPNFASLLIQKFFPGPLTLVLHRSGAVPSIATAGLDTIGVRMPGHPLAHRFLRACGTPVVAPSANLSGRPSPTTWQAVAEDLDGRIDCILKGGASEIGLESTVVDCTTDRPLVLRSGAVSLEQLRHVVPESDIGPEGIPDQPRSPGMKHRHYSPTAQVMLIEHSAPIPEPATSAFIGLDEPSANPAIKQICSSVEEYASLVFEFFRECDRRGIKAIYCQAVADDGIGRALMDRLLRAAKG